MAKVQEQKVLRPRPLERDILNIKISIEEAFPPIQNNCGVVEVFIDSLETDETTGEDDT